MRTEPLGSMKDTYNYTSIKVQCVKGRQRKGWLIFGYLLWYILDINMKLPQLITYIETMFLFFFYYKISDMLCLNIQMSHCLIKYPTSLHTSPEQNSKHHIMPGSNSCFICWHITVKSFYLFSSLHTSENNVNSHKNIILRQGAA